MKPRFHHRTDAGARLAAKLRAWADRPDVIVLGIARGGVAVAAEVARRLHAPLDVLVARKLRLPCRPELCVGALAPGGVCILNDELVDSLDLEGDALGALRRSEQLELERTEHACRGDRPAPGLAGANIILVDDGVATGSTVHAAMVFLHQQNAGSVAIAAPVIPRDALRGLQTMVPDVLALAVPDAPGPVGIWYESFPDLADADVRRCLEESEVAAAAR